MQTPSTPPQCLPPRATVRRPRHALPAGATDCHCHVYEDPQRYPLSAARSYTPALATREQYLAMCDAVGLQRTVQVSASVYGTDNRLTLDVIAALGQHRARGIAGLAPDADTATIEALHTGGMRGVRVSTLVKGYGGTDAIEALAPRVRPLGWHLQLHFHHGDEIAELEPLLMRLDVPLVFDHMGGVNGADGVGSAGFQALLRVLQRRDDVWVKLSSWHRRSRSGAPAYADIAPMAQALVATRPDRLVFGSNWPNPTLMPPDVMPDDGDLIDRLCEWVPDESVRRRIFTDNPAQLYGFDPV